VTFSRAATLLECGVVDRSVVNNQEADELFEDARLACARAAIVLAGGEARRARLMVDQAEHLLHARAVYVASGLAEQLVIQ
jgi:hypothetical protein